MRILNSEASARADKETNEKEQIQSIDLMERASVAFVHAFHEKFKNPGRGIIVCGPGNNGGDGLAIARLLFEKGTEVEVFRPLLFDSVSPAYSENLERLPDQLSVWEGSLEHFQLLLPRFEWLCDGLFGSGMNRPLNFAIRDFVVAMNGFKGLKISIDIPTGLMLNMRSDDISFSADWTGTFQTPKLPFLLPDTGKYVNEFTVLDIGLHSENAEVSAPPFYFLEKEDASKILKPRKKFSHKGTYGHGLIVAGSKGKMGAAVLATKAMLRVGVGLATACIPQTGFDSMQISVPEAMCSDGGAPDFVIQIPDSKFQAIGIGPGLGTNEKTKQMLFHVLDIANSPIVLDADAINILSEHPEWMEKVPKNSILTPHPKEFERLTSKVESSFQTLENAIAFAEKHKVILVLKGAHTCICCPDGSVFFNSTGNPGMATGGSGDVLTGILTGLLAQGYSPLESCKLGVYLHGSAGDLAIKDRGQNGLIAGDLIEYLSHAFSELT